MHAHPCTPPVSPVIRTTRLRLVRVRPSVRPTCTPSVWSCWSRTCSRAHACWTWEQVGRAGRGPKRQGGEGQGGTPAAGCTRVPHGVRERAGADGKVNQCHPAGAPGALRGGSEAWLLLLPAAVVPPGSGYLTAAMAKLVQPDGCVLGVEKVPELVEHAKRCIATCECSLTAPAHSATEQQRTRLPEHRVVASCLPLSLSLHSSHPTEPVNGADPSPHLLSLTRPAHALVTHTCMRRLTAAAAAAVIQS